MRKLLSFVILLAMLVTTVSPAVAQDVPDAGDASPHLYLPVIAGDGSASQLAAPDQPVVPTPDINLPEAELPSVELEDSVTVMAAAPPATATDTTKVPHYFGPNPNWANSPYTLPDVTVTVSGDGSGAAAVASVGANGALAGIVVTNPGVGYTTATVTIAGAGTGASANANVVQSGIVTSIRLDTAGAGYTSPVVTLNGGGGAGTLVQVGNTLAARAYATDFATAPGTLGPVLVVLQAAMPANGAVQAIQYFNQATNGNSPTPSAGNLFHAYVLKATGVPNEYTVAWDSGEMTVPSTADPVGVVESISVPNIPVTTNDRIAFYGEGIPLDVGGGTDILSYLAPAAPTGTITVGGAGFPVYSQDRTYSIAASVVDMSAVAPLTGATATAFGGVDAVNLIVRGSGYTMPTVDFDLPDAPDGVQAKAHALLDANGGIDSVVIDNPGSGYLQAPNVVIRDGTLFDPIVAGPGFTAAEAVATLSLQSITVDSFGAGYTSAPAVTVADAVGSGSGATATASISAGGIVSIDLTAAGSGYITTGGIKKFIDPLPGLCMPPACPTSGKYIPVAVPEAKVYNGIEADEYVIGLVQYRTRFSSSLPPTLVRGYAQIETAANAGVSQHYPLMTANVNPNLPDTPVLINGQPAFAVTAPQWLGPTIVASKDKPVRIVFHNLLPTGAAGDLFLPVDATMMGSGMGPNGDMAPMDLGSVTDGVRNPLCTQEPKSPDCFKDNRATLHLHGGITPWISDGTPHQWITPAGENATYPQGVSVGNVPDMNVCTAADDGCQTFYYTNQQSARLMFYHDHAWGITRLNVYAGEAAGYLITDSAEQALVNSGTIPSVQIPLVVQDRTFVPQDTQLYDQQDVDGNVTSYGQDPSWDQTRWGGYGNFWYHHVYMPAQNPGDPGGMSAYGRWMYGPWFWPPAANTVYGPIANPYYNMDPKTNFTTPLAVPCNLDDPATWQYQTDPFCEPELIPGTPNVSAGMEQFNDTPIVNGVAYPTLTLEPKAYRLRILNAANDRFFNLQWYIGDASTASTDVNTLGQVIGATEVALNPAELAAAQTDPVVFPTPIKTAGPDWIQIGSEGGFLPAPVVIDGQQPTTWVTDPTRFDVGNVDLHSLLVAPAERADVIVDFAQFAGQTLILYNDAPAAFPARVPSYDYYTGSPDMSPNGAPVILPGYGPNTRTVMQVKISGTPAPAFNLTKLQTAFRHNAAGTGVFESSQHPIIVGQAAYNSAYGASFATSGNCNAPGSTLQRCDGLVRVNDTQSFGFNTLRSQNTKVSMPLQPKAIHDEMNSTTFDEFGRMQANLGVEAQPPTPGVQNVTLYPYTNPATELIDATNLPRMDVSYDANGKVVNDVKISPISNMADGTQIWRITHNGVDTHPIHFHLYDVQVLNRVTWDNIILMTEPNELGWKDTVRVSPLEDTIVALRPIIPELPWELPNAIRALSPMSPIGSQMGFNNVDPQGNPTTPITNQLVNFGWEYVYHCHILSHEEMDMMRPVSVAVPPVRPNGLAATVTVQGVNFVVNLTWNDNSIAETSYLVQRSTAGGAWENVVSIASPLDQVNGTGVRTFSDTTVLPSTTYQYRIVALNEIGYGSEFPSMTVQSTSDLVTATTSAPPVIPAAPTNLTATLGSVDLAWTDNATNETGYVVERSDNGGAYFVLVSLAADSVSYKDTAILPGNTYSYRVFAVNAVGSSAPSNTVTMIVPPLPLAPSNLVLTVQGSLTTGPSIRLVFRDNQNNTNPESGFQVFRSDNGGAFVLLTTLPPRNNTGNVTYIDPMVVAGSTYSYYVVTFNAIGVSAPTNTATAIVPPAPAAPSNFSAAATLTNRGTLVRLNFSWTDNSNNESRFVIQRADDPNFTVNVVSVNRGANTTTWSASNLPRGVTYYYRIMAQNNFGQSAWVNLTPFPITTP